VGGLDARALGQGRLMLRTVFVVIALAVGWGFALQSALYAACLYLFIAYFRPEAWAWNDIFTTLNLSYAAGVFLVFRTLISGIRLQIDLRTSLLLLFLAHALLTASLGLDTSVSLAYWQEFAKVIIVGYILTLVIQTPSDFRLVLTVIVASLGFETVKQGWAQLVLNPGAPNINSVPFLGDNNLVAVGMAMLLPIIAALGATTTGWRKRVFQFMNIGVLYRGLSTYSRGGFLSIGVVGAMQFWRSQHKLKTAAAVIVVALIVLPVLPQQFWDRMGTITASSDERDDSQQSRLHFWRVAIAMANDRPWIGVGHRGYERAYNQYDWTKGQFLTNRAVHSAWFGVLGDQGYPGLLLFVTIVLTSWLACRRVRRWSRRGQISGALGQYAIAIETSLVAFAVGGSFVSFQYNEMLWHFFALTIALERVAVRDMAAQLELAKTAEPAIPVEQVAPEPEFAWG
jgi:putative inorganic carbon (hco3(-)) transporter